MRSPRRRSNCSPHGCTRARSTCASRLNCLGCRPTACIWVKFSTTSLSMLSSTTIRLKNGLKSAAKHHEVIFRIFRRLHGREEYGGGTGAGLTIVRKIVERHGGRIWLVSQPGAGSTFYFTLGTCSDRPHTNYVLDSAR